MFAQIKYFPVFHIWKHWQKYFLPTLKTFDETLFFRLPTLVTD
jgi:hypothetical protein